MMWVSENSKCGWRSSGTKMSLKVIVRLFLIWQNSFRIICLFREGITHKFFAVPLLSYFFVQYHINENIRHSEMNFIEFYFFIFVFINDLSIKSHVLHLFTKHHALWQRTFLKEHKIRHRNQKPKSTLKLKKKTPPKQLPALSSIYEVKKKAGSV